jgi:hypothetical protein
LLPIKQIEDNLKLEVRDSLTQQQEMSVSIGARTIAGLAKGRQVIFDTK